MAIIYYTVAIVIAISMIIAGVAIGVAMRTPRAWRPKGVSMKDPIMIRRTYDLWKTSSPYDEDPQTMEADCPKCGEMEMIIIMFDPITEKYTLECPACGETFKRDALA